MKSGTDRIGILLINLGTPSSPDPASVRHYLNEFLTDRHVIDLPWPLRQFLVRCVIVPRRYRYSASLYRKIWTTNGSPLLFHTLNLKKALQESLGNSFLVKVAMRYQHPSIQNSLDTFHALGIRSLLIVPLFPQFSTATTGSIHHFLSKKLPSYSPPFIPKQGT